MTYEYTWIIPIAIYIIPQIYFYKWDKEMDRKEAELEIIKKMIRYNMEEGKYYGYPSFGGNDGKYYGYPSLGGNDGKYYGYPALRSDDQETTH